LAGKAFPWFFLDSGERSLQLQFRRQDHSDGADRRALEWIRLRSPHRDSSRFHDRQEFPSPEQDEFDPRDLSTEGCLCRRVWRGTFDTVSDYITGSLSGCSLWKPIRERLLSRACSFLACKITCQMSALCVFPRGLAVSSGL